MKCLQLERKSQGDAHHRVGGGSTPSPIYSWAGSVGVGMYLLVAGLILLGLKFFEMGLFADISWWWVALPFGLTALWWTWADWSGYTKRKKVEEENKRIQQRIQKHKDKLATKVKR